MNRMRTIIIMLLLLTAGMAAARQASDYVPVIDVVEPAVLRLGYSSAPMLGGDVHVTAFGQDPNNSSGLASGYRFLLVEAVVELEGVPVVIDDRATYDLHGAGLLAFDGDGWSDWSPLDRGLAELHFPDLAAGMTYLLGLQVMDEHGLVSTALTYGATVHNFTVDEATAPTLLVREHLLGEHVFLGPSGLEQTDIASGQPLSFRWAGDASWYGGAVASYRWGWDLADPDDPDDPGWNGPAGLDEEHTRTGEIGFDAGMHRLTVDCLDTAGHLTRAAWILSVVPVPAWEDRLPVLLVDDVRDQVSNLWPDATGAIAYDRDAYRDQFWNDVLAPVAGWRSGVDVVDVESDGDPTLRDAVMYQTVIWSTAAGTQSSIARQFSQRDSWVWLDSFVANVGHLFLAGSGALMNFSPTTDGDVGMLWVMPVLYDSMESPRTCDFQPRALSFGPAPDGDGGLMPEGVRRYGHRSAGMSLVNQLVPATFWLSGTQCGYGEFDVRRRCAGTKAVALDADFAAAHGAAGALQDTVAIWDAIDWADAAADGIPDLGLTYAFGALDEVYDFNATSRPSPWAPQELDDGSPVLEPMWRVVPRYDRIRALEHAAGNTDWPAGLDVDALCSAWTVDPATGATRNAGAPIGVLSHKHAAGKPSGRADVYWGFDPYRMDHAAMTDAVRWVLGEHFGHELER